MSSQEHIQKNCDTVKVDVVSVFLQNLLVAIPLNNDDFVYDCKAAILDPSRFPDLWSVLAHLVKSSFDHHGIPQDKITRGPQLVKYPICDLLIHFYVEFILKFLSLKDDLFGNSYCNRRNDLMRWINELYKFHVEEVEILKDLHNLLDQAVNSKVMLNASCSSVALNETSVFEAVSQLFIICKDVFVCHDRFVRFLSYTKLPYLSAYICFYMLLHVTKRKRFTREMLTSITLKELIRYFFFINLPFPTVRDCSDVFFVKGPSVCLKDTNQEGRVTSLQNLTTGDKQMHKMCRSNLIGDLLRTLLKKSRLDLNITNHAGQTPLHVACISANYLCVKFLLDPIIGQRHRCIKILAVDKELSTPLHYAVMANDEDIVRMLLEEGGERVLHKKDSYNLKPHHYCVSTDMKEIFKNYFPNVSFESNASLAEEFKISTINEEDYMTYLYALHSLLSYYFDIFKLYNCGQKNCKVEAHNEKKCSHFSSTDNVICVEDESVIHSLPKCIEELIKRVEDDALQIKLDVKKQVRLLKLFSLTIPTVR